MTVSVTQVITKNANQFIELFASEWRHDIPRSSPSKGHVIVPSEIGLSEMSADGDVLEVTVTAPSLASAAYLEAAVSEFLDRVAGDEELHYQWTIQPDMIEGHNVSTRRGEFNWSELTLAQG
jgi:hypothetical protein